MPLIHAMEISNFMNYRRKQPWSPDWRHARFLLKGLHTAINIPNGRGKSTVIQTILSMLVWDTKSLKEMKRTHWAPAGSPAFTHVRIEITNRNLVQAGLFAGMSDPTDGGHMVFGVYGNSDDDNPEFYAYHGSLDDCPLALVEKDRITLLTKEEFLENLGRLKATHGLFPAHPKDRQGGEWQRFVGDFFDMSSLQQQHKYQLANGAEGSAKYFDVEKPRGNYSAELFYKHLAPELLSELMGGYGEEGEHGIEDTIHEKARGVVQARRETDQKTEELAGAQRVLTALAHLNRISATIDAKARDVVAAQGVLANEYFALQDALFTRAVPGVPHSPGSELPSFYQHFVLQDGEWWISDRGLAIFSGEDAKRVNERAGRGDLVKSVEIKKSQVLDFTCDLSSEYANSTRPGWKPKLFNREASLALLTKTSHFGHTWNRETALSALDVGFRWVASNGDTNPARRGLAVIELQLQKDKDLKSTGEVALTDVKLRTESLNRELQRLKGNATAWQHIVDSTLFTPDEMDNLSDTAIAVERAATSSEEVQRKHHQMVGERIPLQEGWIKFVESHGDARPADVAERLTSQRAYDSERVTKLVSALRLAREEATRKSAQSANWESAWSAIDARIAKARELSVLAQGYGRIFGTASPVDLEAEVLRAAQSARDELARNQATFHRHSGALEAVAAFAAAYPTTAPAAWLLTRRLRKAECHEQLKSLRGEHQGISELANRAERYRAEALSFEQYYGSDAPSGLEAAVRSALKRAEAELARHLEQLARWCNERGAIVAFQIEEGARDPTEWLTDRDTRRGHALSLLDCDEPALAEAVTLREALDDAPVAPGPIARDVARIAGSAAISLHEFVESLSLSHERRGGILTLFSALLFSPVFMDLSAARAAATLLAEEEIEAPVFMGPALESFCRSGEICIDGASASAIFVGVRTRKVECLLDPTLIELEKGRLDAQIAGLELSCGAARKSLEELALGLEMEPIAKLAAQALADGVPEKAAVIEAAAASLRSNMPRLLRRASDAAIAAIRAALLLRAELKMSEDSPVLAVDAELAKLEQRRDQLAESISVVSRDLSVLEEGDDQEAVATAAAFALSEGIPERAASLRSEIDQQHAALPLLEERASPDAVQAIRNQVRLEAFLAGDTVPALLLQQAALSDACEAAKREAGLANVLCDELEREKDGAELAWRHSEKAALEADRLAPLQTYVDDPDFGPTFMSGHVAVGERLNAAMHLAQRRVKFDFKTALLFVGSGGAGHLLALQNQHAELTTRAEKLDRFIREKSQAIEDMYPARDPLLRAASQIDASVRRLRERWSQIATVLDAPPPVPAEQFAQHPLSIGAAQWRSLSTAEEIAANMSSVCDGLATAEETSVIDVLKNAVAALKRAQDTLGVEIDRTLGDASLKLPETARVKLAQSKMVREFLPEMVSTSEASYAKNAEANRIAIEHLTKERDQLSVWLSNFTLRLPENLKTLRTVFSPKHGCPPGESRAGFEIEATVIDNNGIGTLIEKIIRSVEDLENGQLASAGSSEKLRAQIHATLRETIRDTFYREVILSPRIRLVLPSISGRALEMERKMASSGQGVAITFLWILKLAEFINEREIRRQTVDGAKRRRVRDKASAFTLLDGAFSHLSDKNLINETLAGIENSLGRFQLIITGHDPAYENDFKRFPALVAAREMNGHYMRASSHHHTMGHDAELGLMESFHAIQVSKPGLTDEVRPS